MTKLEKNNVFMERAFAAAEATTCTREDRRIGAVAVRDGVVIAEAANGLPEGLKMKTCKQRGYCARKKMNIASGTAPCVPYCICGEQKLLAKAAREGISVDGADVYATHKPCSTCIKLLICAGVKRVFYRDDYPDKITDDIVKQAEFALVRV